MLIDAVVGDVDDPGAEAGLAIGEVVVPHAPEPLVEAERADLRPALVEAPGQRASVSA